MKKRYTLIDNTKNKTFHYFNWQWNLAFTIIFISGMITGICIF